MGYGDKAVGHHRADTALWHLADVERALTWCGLDVGYGNPRRTWSETPETKRCEMCIDSYTRSERHDPRNDLRSAEVSW
jgi:hypothetical protein